MCADLRNVPDALLRHAAERGDEVALRTLDGETWTWREYLERAARFAGGLRSLGVQPGDRIVLMLRNRREFHVADVGALLVGATPISIYNSSSSEQIAYLASHCEATTIVTESGDFLDRVRAAELSTVGRIVAVGDDVADTTPYEHVVSADPVDVEAAVARIAPTDLLTVIY